jgi:hypothetical protein
MCCHPPSLLVWCDAIPHARGKIRTVASTRSVSANGALSTPPPTLGNPLRFGPCPCYYSVSNSPWFHVLHVHPPSHAHQTHAEQFGSPETKPTSGALHFLRQDPAYGKLTCVSTGGCVAFTMTGKAFEQSLASDSHTTSLDFPRSRPLLGWLSARDRVRATLALVGGAMGA